MANVRDYSIKCIAIDYPYFSFEYSQEVMNSIIEVSVLLNAKSKKAVCYLNSKEEELQKDKAEEIMQIAQKRCKDDISYIGNIM